MANIRQTRQLFSDICLLLQTVDQRTEENGWKPEGGGVATITEHRSHISYPQNWAPWYAFRFYKNSKWKNILSYVSVLLDNPPDKDYEINQPLVTGGVFDYGAGNSVERDWEYWFATWYAYVKYLGFDREISGDGIIERGINDDWKIKWQEVDGTPVPFVSFKCFGVPLLSVSNPADVESKIIKPMLTILPKKMTC